MKAGSATKWSDRIVCGIGNVKHKNDMTQEEQIEIPLSKKKMLLAIFGAVVFTGMGVFLMVLPIFQIPIHFAETFFATFHFIIGLVGALFFGIGAVVIFWHLFDRKPGLIINDQGIVIGNSSKNSTLVLWSDIEEIVITKIHNQNFLTLMVKNPRDYIDRVTNPFTRKLAEINFNICGSPFSITTSTLQVKSDDLLNLLTKKLDEYKML